MRMSRKRYIKHCIAVSRYRRDAIINMTEEEKLMREIRRKQLDEEDKRISEENALLRLQGGGLIHIPPESYFKSIGKGFDDYYDD